jgi:hypothetical protein
MPEGASPGDAATFWTVGPNSPETCGGGGAGDGLQPTSSNAKTQITNVQGILNRQEPLVLGHSLVIGHLSLVIGH